MDILKSVNLIKADGTKKPSSEVFAGKDFICIYFSAHWCPPCRGFTPVLKDFYEVSAQCFLNLSFFLYFSFWFLFRPIP